MILRFTSYIHSVITCSVLALRLRIKYRRYFLSVAHASALADPAKRRATAKHAPAIM